MQANHLLHHSHADDVSDSASITPRQQNLDAISNTDINQNHERQPHNLNNHNLLPTNNPEGIGNSDSRASHESSEKSVETDDSEVPHQIIDLASQKHGPDFLQLDRDEQSWLLKLHRNLGHPGQAKLTEFS